MDKIVDKWNSIVWPYELSKLYYTKLLGSRWTRLLRKLFNEPCRTQTFTPELSAKIELNRNLRVIVKRLNKALQASSSNSFWKKKKPAQTGEVFRFHQPALNLATELVSHWIWENDSRIKSKTFISPNKGLGPAKKSIRGIICFAGSSICLEWLDQCCCILKLDWSKQHLLRI